MSYMMQLDQRYKWVLEALRLRGRLDSMQWLRGVYNNEDLTKIEDCIALMERRTVNDRLSTIYPSVH